MQRLPALLLPQLLHPLSDACCVLALYPQPTHPSGLDLLEPLVGASGGTALLYTCLEAAALPQDVSRGREFVLA